MVTDLWCLFPIFFQVACPSVKETVEGADVLVFVLPHQVRTCLKLYEANQ